MGLRENQRLIRAAQCSLGGSMSKALAAGADPDAADDEIDGGSALGLCAHAGWMQGVELLLDAGADIECSKAGYPALFCAASSGHPELAEFLLSKGATPNGASKDGSSALLSACGWPHGRSADHFIRHDRCAELLISAGACIDSKSPADGCHPMLDAARWGRLGALSMLVEAAKAVGAWEGIDQAELVGAAASGGAALPCLELLVASGAGIDGSQALVKLIESGNFGNSWQGQGHADVTARRLAAIRFLVGAGAGMEEQRVPHGGSALFRAVELLGPESPEALLLVELGAAQGKAGPGGLTALERACQASGSAIMGLWRARALAGAEFRELCALQDARAPSKASLRV